MSSLHSALLPRLAGCLLSCSLACSGNLPPAPTPAPAPQKAPPDLGYCGRLQPLLTQAVSSSRIGTEMSCLDIPGVTELGRYGSPSAGEEASLANCFDEASGYETLLEPSESELDLDIQQLFSTESGATHEASLSALVPWLPRIEVDTARTKRVTARVVLRKARFITLIGLASRLQGQKRERQCLEALCRPEYSYVHKVLVGVPTLSITALDARGQKLGVGAGFLSANYRSEQSASGSREITSTQPVTLAIARSQFRSAQTDRLCQFCGKRDQSCCSADPGCDGGLGCIGERCIDVGGPEQPCDNHRCSEGAACVAGRCRVTCGGKGQPCCAEDSCSGSLRCTPDPQNGLELSVTSELFPVEGGFFGTSEDRTFGNSSCGALRTRARFALTKVGPGRGKCDKAWWFDPNNQKDCRVMAHFDVSTFGSIQCRVEVFATAPARPNRCED